MGDDASSGGTFLIGRRSGSQLHIVIFSLDLPAQLVVGNDGVEPLSLRRVVFISEAVARHATQTIQ
jgi:hypothetical protein